MSVAFEYKNSKGTTYYLHKKVVTLRGSNKEQTIYYFAREKGSNAVDQVPEGFKVMEIQRTGLPVLKKK